MRHYTCHHMLTKFKHHVLAKQKCWSYVLMKELWIVRLKSVCCCQLWSGCKTPGQRERSSRRKQELAGDMLRYSRKQRGVTTVTRMMTDRLDLQFNHSLVFKKVEPQASSQNHISS